MADEQEQYSPFAYANNNPILLNDPLGLISDSLHPIVQPEVVLTGIRQKSNYVQAPATVVTMPKIALGGLALPLGNTGAGVGIGTGVATSTVVGTVIAAGVWAQVKVSELDRNLRAQRWYIVYRKTGPNGEVYIGRCSGFGNSPEEVLKRYDKSHRLRNDYGEAQILDVMNGSITGSVSN